MFISDERSTLETIDFIIRTGSTPTFLYFDLYLDAAHAVHYVYFIIWLRSSSKWVAWEDMLLHLSSYIKTNNMCNKWVCYQKVVSRFNIANGPAMSVI